MVTGENFVEFRELDDPIKIIFNQISTPIPLRYTNGVEVNIALAENEMIMKDSVFFDIFSRTEKVTRFLSVEGVDKLIFYDFNTLEGLKAKP